PSELVEAAAGRLAVLALLAAAAVVLFAIADWRSFAKAGAVPNMTLWLGAAVASLSLSLSIAWVAWRGMLAPAGLLDVGLIYEVAQALCIALVFHSVPLQAAMAARGLTAVAVWFVAYPLIVPAPCGTPGPSTAPAGPLGR